MKKNFFQYEEKQYKNRQNIFYKQMKQFKTSIFNSIYFTLMNKEKSNILNYILIVIEWTQILMFFFQQYFSDLWDVDTKVNILQKISQFILIAPLIQKLDYLVATLCLIFVFLIIMAGILFCYIVSSHKNKSNGYKLSLTIKINYYSMKLLSTILTMPFFILIIQNTKCEKNDQNNYILNYYNDQKCFDTLHIINILLEIIILAIYLPFLYSICQFFYETSFKLNRFTCRLPTNSFILIILYKVVLMIVYFFYLNQNSHYLVLLSALFLMFFICKQFVYENNILYRRTECLYRFFSISCLWTILLLTSIKILGQQLFGKALSLYTIGIIFIFLIVIQYQKDLQNISYKPIDYQSSKQIINKLKYFIYLLHNHTDLFCESQIDGLILDHTQQCQICDCQIKKKFLKGRFQNYYNERMFLFKELIIQMFQVSLKKYKNDAWLRFMYVLFLFDEMNLNHKIMQQLEQMKKLRPGIQLQFQIYRFQKMITENDELQNSVLIKYEDENNSLVYQNLKSKFYDTLQRLINFNLDFWNHLLDDNPKSYKLKKIGQQIDIHQKRFTQNWQQLYCTFQNKIVKEIFLYGQFQQKILNNEIKAEKFMKMAKQIAQQKLQNLDNIEKITEKTVLNQNSNNIIIISGQKENTGEILSTNNQLCKFFGYNKDELIGQNITILMPHILQLNHSQYILDAVESKSLDSFKRERKMFAINSKGFLISVFINIKQILEPNPIVVGEIRPEKHLQTEVYFLVDFKGFIHHVSQSVFVLFKIKRDTLKQFKYITDLFPGLFKDKENYLDKQRPLKNEHMFDGPLSYMKNENIQLLITEQKYKKITKSFFILKFSKQKNNKEEKKDFTTQLHKQNLNLLQFQFRVNTKDYKIIGEKSTHRLFNTDLNIIIDKNNTKKKQKDYFDYAEGIEVLRLKEGKIIKYEQNKSEENLETLENKIYQKFSQLKSKLDFAQSNLKKNLSEFYAKDGNLQRYIQKQKKPFFFQLYKYFVNSLIIVFIVLQIFLFFINFYQIQKFQYIDHFYNDFNIMNLEMSSILGGLKGLIILNEAQNVYFLHDQQLRKQISHNTQYMHYLEEHLFLQTKQLKESKIKQQYTNSKVTLTINNQKNDLILTEAINYIQTFSIKASNEDLKYITPSNQSIKYLYYNVNFALQQAFQEMNDLLITAHFNKAHDFYIQLAIIIVYWFLLFCLFLVIFYFLKQLQQYQFINLKIFAEIDNKIIYQQIQNCQQFVSIIEKKGKTVQNRIGEVQQNQTNENEENEIKLLKKKRMIQQNFFKNHKLFLVQVLFLCITVVAICTIQSFWFKQQKMNQNKIVRELQLINQIPFQLQQLKNVIFYEQQEELQTISTYLNNKIIKTQIQNVFNSIEELQNTYNQQKYLHGSEYLQFSEKLIYSNLCDLAQDMSNGKFSYENFNYYQPDINQCRDMQDSPYSNYIQNGFIMQVTQQIEHLKNFYNELTICQNKNDFRQLKNEFCKNRESPIFSNCIFLSEELKILDDIQNQYINYFSTTWKRLYLIDARHYCVNQVLSKNLMIQIVTFTILIFIYIFYFMNFINKKKQSIEITQNILLMLPKQFLKKQNKIEQISQQKNTKVQEN